MSEETEKKLAEGFRALYARTALDRTWREHRVFLILSVSLVVCGCFHQMWLSSAVYTAVCFMVFAASFYREAFHVATDIEAHEEMKRRRLK